MKIRKGVNTMSEACNESSCSSCSVEGCSSRKAADMKEPANQYSHIKHVIGIVSGKGGVGKSLVTSELAVKLHRQGYKVGILDADMILLARDIAKQIEAELEYPGQIKVNVIRESRVMEYAK